MTSENLAAILAERVMGWTVGPDRFMMGNRGWTPRWRFQPFISLEDAFRLLEETAPLEYSMWGDSKGNFRVKVRIVDGTGEAGGTSKPRAITLAVARALAVPMEIDE